jgi:predicted ATPase
MITRFEIDGLKSLGQFAVDLEPFTVFIGPNSAGKSNILEAMALLSRLSSMSMEEAFKQGRGRAIDQFTRRGGEAGRSIRFAAELFVPDMTEGAESAVLPSRYRYELSIERQAQPSGGERLVVSDEKLSTIDSANDPWLSAHPKYAEHAKFRVGAMDILKQVAVTARGRHLTEDGRERDESGLFWAPLAYTALASYSTGRHRYSVKLDLLPETLERLDAIKRERGLRSRGEALDSVIRSTLEVKPGILPQSERNALGLVTRALASFRLVHVDAARLRDPSERIGSETLDADGANLPTVLANLPPAILGGIRADLVSLVPGISTFEVVADGETFRIELELSGGERLPARLVSDGTLRILVLLTALQTEPRPAVLGIEEPENGIYPGRLGKLVEYLRENAAEPSGAESVATQLVMTTHSPVVLASLLKDPEHLRFIDLVRRQGQLVTRARVVSATASADRGSASVELREIDALLHSVGSEIAS